MEKSMQRTLTAATVGVLALAVQTPAYACGGFFCNNEPIEQSGEQIVFEVDGGQVTTHVQIAYAGRAEEFAWIVPVPNIPDIGISTDALFSAVSSVTQPTFMLETKELGTCDMGMTYWGYPESALMSSSASIDYAASSYGGVNVVATENVGPYETVTLQADSSEALLDWLQANDYDLPDALDPVLNPYVAGGAYFIALKLQAGKDTGDLTPLSFMYDAKKAMIPIQLTSVAATPDMRLEVYIFGDHRAVPESYLHVQVNEAAVDWWSGGSNYRDIITKAADEAGGHAFATDYSGPTDAMVGITYRDDMFDLEALRQLTDPVAFMSELMTQAFSGTDLLLEVLSDNIPVPPGTDAQDFFNCLECYEDHLATIDFDPVTTTADLEARIVEPLRAADELFAKHSLVTRMTSSISPIEMTIDPVFVYNPDMTQNVDKDRQALQLMLCMKGERFDEAQRVLVLEDGRQILLPSMQWFWDKGISETEYLQQMTGVSAYIIEATSDSGDPEVLYDHSATGLSEVDANNEKVQAMLGAAASGCGGCSSTSAPGAPGLALFGLVLGFLRRRSA
jgi:MYXO-CTERM domain-containing protein